MGFKTQEQASIEEICQQAVQYLIDRHDWRLLDAGAWARRLCGTLSPTASPEEVRREAMHLYCLALYHACSGSEGESRAERGWSEVYHYQREIAHWRAPDIAEDVTNEAWLRLYRSFARCYLPDTFLAFAMQKVRDAIRHIRGQERKLEPLYPSHPDPRLLAEGDFLADIKGCLEKLEARFAQRYPERRQQFEVLRIRYQESLDAPTTAQRVGLTVKQVYTACSKARAVIRGMPEAEQCARLLGILDEGPGG